ncbi:MAG: DNA polymerase III subunit chi [Rickettsiales bacterium]
MTTIQFYHLLSTTPERAVPKLMEKALAGNHRVVMLLRDAEALKRMSDTLWSADASSFLPHGSSKEGRAADQPIYLTTADENPNHADLLCILNASAPAGLVEYARVLDMFDGSNESEVALARERWSAHKAAGHTLQYIKQQPGGGWKIEAEAA